MQFCFYCVKIYMQAHRDKYTARREAQKMVNILFDCPNIDVFHSELSKYFSPTDRVCVVAFSFYDDYVYDAKSWDKVYGEEIGNGYFETINSFIPYGICKENITFINYFTDTKESAVEKIKNADIIYFTGGLPDRMMDRINDFDLSDAIMSHKGVVMGYSAGAVIQLGEYHLSPDADYAEFGYYKGLPMLNGFYIEVHYEFKESQNASIKRVLRERNKTVYVTHTRKGGIVVEDGRVTTVGQVDVYKPD